MYAEYSCNYFDDEPPVDEIYEKVMNSGVFEKGFEVGFEVGFREGHFLAAVNLKKFLSIDDIVKISGFSIEELEKEELIDDDLSSIKFRSG